MRKENSSTQRNEALSDPVSYLDHQSTSKNNVENHSDNMRDFSFESINTRRSYNSTPEVKNSLVFFIKNLTTYLRVVPLLLFYAKHVNGFMPQTSFSQGLLKHKFRLQPVIRLYSGRTIALPEKSFCKEIYWQTQMSNSDEYNREVRTYIPPEVTRISTPDDHVKCLQEGISSATRRIC